MKSPIRIPSLLRAAAVAAAVAAIAPEVRAEKLFLLTNTNGIVTIDHTAPGTSLGFVAITGLGANETVVGFDIRPRDGTLVALTTASRLYNVNPGTGAATAIGAGPFTPALSGTTFGFDFNPTVDRIRLVSDTRQDLRLNPDTGTVAFVDGTETYAATDVNAGRTPTTTAAAYSGSGPNATITMLYVIDTALGVLTLQNPPNNGTLVTLGPLGVTPGSNISGFDISNRSERAYALFNNAGGTPTLYSINITTGAATSLGAVTTQVAGAPNGVVSGYAGLTVPFPNNLRRASASSFVSKSDPIFLDLNIGSTSNQTPTAGAPARMLIRGLGPSIGGLADPRLRVFRQDGTRLASSDSFTEVNGGAAITATGLAPSSAAEPALILNLPPGFYTVRLNSKSNSDTGNARIEAFEIE